MLVVCIGCEMLKNLLPDSGFSPTTEASMHLHSIAKAFRQVTPWQASAIAIQNGLDKQAIVPGRHAHRPWPAQAANLGYGPIGRREVRNGASVSSR